jgi:hypothetical protein
MNVPRKVSKEKQQFCISFNLNRERQFCISFNISRGRQL